MSKRRKNNKKKVKKGLKRWKQLSFKGKIWRFIWVTLLALFGFSIFQVLFCAVFNPPITPLMVTRFFEQVKDPNREVRFERDYVRLDKISQNLVNAVTVSEDGLFMYHHGFDVKQLKMSYIEGKKGRRHRGGSTISMQTAKNCFLPHKHSVVRKAVEAYYTTLIEKIWGKKRIMECYLNVIEFGDGIYGCEAAAQHYFHHSAEHLTRREAALLAVCLPSPLKMNPGRPGPYLSRQASVVQGRMSKYGRINLDAKREDLNPRYLKEMDETLWDFVWWVVTDGETLTPKKKK
jgi:monofunctional biosynthetic peptidoglycan transglycosylase